MLGWGVSTVTSTFLGIIGSGVDTFGTFNGISTSAGSFILISSTLTGFLPTSFGLTVASILRLAIGSCTLLVLAIP